MAYIKLIIALALVCPIILVSSAQIDSMDLESRINARLMHLEQKNSELENELKATKVDMEMNKLELKATKLEMDRMKSVFQSERMYGTKNSFDCHLNDKYDTNGVITFSGCSGINNNQCSDPKLRCQISKFEVHYPIQN